MRRALLQERRHPFAGVGGGPAGLNAATVGAVRLHRMVGPGPGAINPGDPYPLGATWDGSGTNFSLFSGLAEQVSSTLAFGDLEQELVVDLEQHPR